MRFESLLEVTSEQSNLMYSHVFHECILGAVCDGDVLHGVEHARQDGGVHILSQVRRRRVPVGQRGRVHPGASPPHTHVSWGAARVSRRTCRHRHAGRPAGDPCPPGNIHICI
eukprot:5618344-Pyramimonas_sp.AAC.1